MSFKKFEDRRREAQKELEDRLAKIAAEEAQEREKRIKPLSDRFLTIFQDIMLKALNDRVDDLDRPKFRKTLIRSRLEAAVKIEIDALVASDEGDLLDAAEESEDGKSVQPVQEAPPVPRKARPVPVQEGPATEPAVGG
jgi:hypothetical protein